MSELVAACACVDELAVSVFQLYTDAAVLKLGPHVPKSAINVGRSAQCRSGGEPPCPMLVPLN